MNPQEATIFKHAGGQARLGRTMDGRGLMRTHRDGTGRCSSEGWMVVRIRAHNVEEVIRVMAHNIEPVDYVGPALLFGAGPHQCQAQVIMSKVELGVPRKGYAEIILELSGEITLEDS